MTGHVFVVNGRIEKVVHDVAIVPTASNFHIRGYWKPILGEDTGQWRPRRWPVPGMARRVGGRTSNSSTSAVVAARRSRS
jgi:hypothetical protein